MVEEDGVGGVEKLEEPELGLELELVFGAGAGGTGVAGGVGGELEELREGVHREELHPEQEDLLSGLCRGRVRG